MMWVDRAGHLGKIFRKRQEERQNIHRDHAKEKSWVDAFCGARAENVISLENSFPAQIQASFLFVSFLPVSEAASLGSSF